MKITDVKPLIMGNEWRNLVFLKVETDEGITGFGEATVQNREEGVLGFLEGAKRRHIIGSDPFNVEDLSARLYRNDFWRNGVIAMTVQSAVEIACWDIMGKALGQPVYRLLGGRCRDRIKAYANGWYTVDRDPLQFAARAKEVVKRGYRALKVDPFGSGGAHLEISEIRRAADVVAAVREAVGPEFEIMIECHGRFSLSTALSVARALEPYCPAWLEEPVIPEDLRSLREVKDAVRCPVAAGERLFTRYQYVDLFERRCVHIIQPDLIHAGGFLEMKKIAGMAEACSMMVAPHNSNSPLCTAASAHFDTCTTNIYIQEVFDDFTEPAVLKAICGAPRVVNGFLEVSDRPGLGIELDEDAIASRPYKPGFFNIWEEGWHRRQFTTVLD